MAFSAGAPVEVLTVYWLYTIFASEELLPEDTLPVSEFISSRSSPVTHAHSVTASTTVRTTAISITESFLGFLIVKTAFFDLYIYIIAILCPFCEADMRFFYRFYINII